MQSDILHDFDEVLPNIFTGGVITENSYTVLKLLTVLFVETVRSFGVPSLLQDLLGSSLTIAAFRFREVILIQRRERHKNH